jgi:hypothetical protein
LPLDQKIFDTWIQPVVGSVWEEQAKKGGIRNLGQRIRQSLLERCRRKRTTDSTDPLGTTRQIREGAQAREEGECASLANNSARPSKKRKTKDTRAEVQETASTGRSITTESPASPITPSALPPVHRIHSRLSGEGYNTDQINRYGVGDISQSIHAANQSTDTLNATNNLEASPSNDLSAPPAQIDTWPPPPPPPLRPQTSGVGSLGVVALGGGAASGSGEANYPASRRQNIHGTPPDGESIYSTSPTGGVSAETFLPPLFYAMGDYIPKVLLDRAISPQPRWSEHGEFCEVTPHDAGLHQDLVDLLSDDAKLKQRIEELISLSIICEVSRDGLQTYACRDEAARVTYDQDRAYWIHRAFELCCYVFPQSQILDSS